MVKGNRLVTAAAAAAVILAPGLVRAQQATIAPQRGSAAGDAKATITPQPTAGYAKTAAGGLPTAAAPPSIHFDATTRALAIRDLKSPDLARRSAAILRLGTPGQPADLARLVGFLDESDQILRAIAARMLVGAGEPRTIARFTERAADARAPVRLEALVVLRDAPSLPAAARRAAERSLSDGDATLRLGALELLTVHPSGDSVPMVAGVLGDGNREVRLAAVRLLGLSPDQRALLPLLDRIDTSDRSERAAVIEAIGAVGAHPPVDPGPALLRQLDDTNEDVRRAAVDALGRIRYAAAVEELRPIAGREARDLLARRAILALGAIGTAPAIDALVQLLREAAPLDEVRVALRRAGASAISPVAAVLGDGFSSSARAAA